MNRQNTELFKGSEIILYDTTLVDKNHYIFFKTHEMYTNNNL